MALSERDRRTLMIGGGVLAVILVGFLLFTVFTGGEEEALPPTTPGITGPTESLGPTPSAQPTAVFAGRDPFSPPAALAGSPTSPGTSPTSPGTSPTSPGTSPTTTPTQPGGGSSTDVDGKTVVLLDLFTQGGERMAQVEINGNVHNVSQGERFGPGNDFLLQSISGDCARFLFGDEPFTLCVSEEK